jgi:hypothetical protein
MQRTYVVDLSVRVVIGAETDAQAREVLNAAFANLSRTRGFLYEAQAEIEEWDDLGMSPPNEVIK